MKNNIIIIGGGFFGLYLADFCAKLGYKVKLIEKEQQLMSRASFTNQARVHNGYHYPRSMLTAMRSKESFPRFVREFEESIYKDFDKYYLVAKATSKVTASQFSSFFSRIGATCKPADDKLSELVNPALIDGSFSTVEYAFDALKLKDTMVERLGNTDVEILLNTCAENVTENSNNLVVEAKNYTTGQEYTFEANHVFNCTYSRINHLLARNGLELTELKHEMTEMCIVDVPEELKKMGLTVMCGPFFSVMPFPSEGAHSLSHVRYTPHYSWNDTHNSAYVDAHIKYTEDKRNSAWMHMIKDASRYIPILEECTYRKSIWEVKTILPRSEGDDSRPILFLPNHGMKGFHSIMGGKIDNVYDMIEAIKRCNILESL